MPKEKKKDNKESKHAYKKKSAWETLSKSQIKQSFEFCKKYKDFLNNAKTERESISLIEDAAKKFKKKIVVNRGKAAAIVVPGKQSLKNGIHLIISHVDSPRLDLKQIPLFEENNCKVAMFETHY